MNIPNFLRKTASLILDINEEQKEIKKEAMIDTFLSNLSKEGVISEFKKIAKKEELMNQSFDEVEKLIKMAETFDFSFAIGLAKEAQVDHAPRPGGDGAHLRD